MNIPNKIKSALPHPHVSIPHPHINLPGSGTSADQVAYKKLPVVQSLQPGDILIVKVWGVDKHMIGNVIRGGEFVMTRGSGSSNDQHALLMISPTKTSEAGSAGIHSSAVDTRAHIVFRITNPELAREAAYVGSRLLGLNGSNIKPGGYNYVGASQVFLRQKTAGPRARAFLAKMYDEVYSGKPANGTRLFCSQLVVTCVELAAMKLDLRGLDLDPQATSPKALEGTMNSRPNLFRPIGRYPA